MKKNYITQNFQKTVAERFPAQSAALLAAYQKRLTELRAENADASPEKQRHLEGQILPGIAAYETLQTVMPKEEALETIHHYDNMHPQLLWHRTKTLGRGDDCCDFCLKLKDR